MSNNFDDIFEPAPQAEDFDKEAWAAKKKAERDEVYALADATAEEVCADGGKFREYLDVQANFRHYSATNALLILAAKPDARRLGDKDFWRDQGVYMLSPFPPTRRCGRWKTVCSALTRTSPTGSAGRTPTIIFLRSCLMIWNCKEKKQRNFWTT